MTTDSCWLVLLLAVVLSWLVWAWKQQFLASHPASITAQLERLLKPRTPADCPACRKQRLDQTAAAPFRPPVTPWRECKSHRGAPKRIATHGFACPNHTCRYYRVTDAQVHALVGNGTHGKCERIQTLRCQACGSTCSTRRDTPLYRLKTASWRVGEVLTALAEGLSVAATARVFGHRQATITRWVTRAGEHSATLHNRVLRHLYMPHIQLDELRTRLRNRAHILWLWVAVDPLSKMIPGLHLDARTQDAAHTMMHELRQRLALDCLPVFTSDGLDQYFYALTAHFEHWIAGVGRQARQWQLATGLLYGQVEKT